jgi:twitching motility two-component system response regulator PilH
MERIIVRRGRFLTYELLRRTLGGDPNIEIIWDRRRPMDTLAAASDAPVERRGSPPAEWDRLDYLFTSANAQTLAPNRLLHEPSAARQNMSRVLIVDDSETIVNFLRMILESEQYEVDTASDATDGLAKAHQSLPDLIITDSIMPGMDGFAFLHALRADPATDAVPVIMLTSGDPHDPDHIVRDPQPDAFVKKSADPGPLLGEVREALSRRR